MVPWSEAAEMHLALRACGVPAQHLIYEQPAHNDFVFDWSPARVVAAPGVSQGQQQQQQQQQRASLAAASDAAQSSSSSSSTQSSSMKPFACDLLALVTGRVGVHFDGGSTRNTAAAVAQYERAAGIEPVREPQQLLSRL
jgi:hypothetical protein